MSYRDLEVRRRERERARRARARRRRAGAMISVLGAAVVVAVVLVTGGGGGARSGRDLARSSSRRQGRRAFARGRGRSSPGAGAGRPGDARAPILMYHVINPPPPGAPFPELYVPGREFAAQMRALKRSGWHAVTMDQLEANWVRGVPLGSGKPIVLSFDNGYRSQYTNALPVLRRLGWVGVENLQLSGLPPPQGGLTGAQVRGLLAAGWELDTQGMTHADLIRLDGAQLHHQVATARKILRRRYGVPVNWFCYPSGHYNATVIAAVRAAGFEGSTTVVPGWAQRSDDRYRLPRLRVVAGTTPPQLLAQVAGARADTRPPPAYP